MRVLLRAPTNARRVRPDISARAPMALAPLVQVGNTAMRVLLRAPTNARRVIRAITALVKPVLAFPAASAHSNPISTWTVRVTVGSAQRAHMETRLEAQTKRKCADCARAARVLLKEAPRVLAHASLARLASRALRARLCAPASSAMLGFIL